MPAQPRAHRPSQLAPRPPRSDRHGESRRLVDERPTDAPALSSRRRRAAERRQSASAPRPVARHAARMTARADAIGSKSPAGSQRGRRSAAARRIEATDALSERRRGAGHPRRRSSRPAAGAPAMAAQRIARGRAARIEAVHVAMQRRRDRRPPDAQARRRRRPRPWTRVAAGRFSARTRFRASDTPVEIAAADSDSRLRAGARRTLERRHIAVRRQRRRRPRRSCRARTDSAPAPARRPRSARHPQAARARPAPRRARSPLRPTAPDRSRRRRTARRARSTCPRRRHALRIIARGVERRLGLARPAPLEQRAPQRDRAVAGVAPVAAPRQRADRLAQRRSPGACRPADQSARQPRPFAPEGPVRRAPAIRRAPATAPRRPWRVAPPPP